MKADSHAKMLIDTAAVLVVSVAICLASHHLLFMTLFVPAALALRMVLIVRLLRREGGGVAAELVFYLLCTLLGAVNDWNSVCNKGIYDYAVPHYFPSFSTIPIWMLLFWGMILRFAARLARWEGLRPPDRVSDRLGWGSRGVDRAWLRVLAELVLVVGTRQTIYRWYLDPWWSWIPFALAIALFLLVFRTQRHDRVLAGLFLVGGPLVEVLYIQLGDLHSYHLGWFGGVPLWIVLWWVLAFLVWKDLAFRIEHRLRRWLG